MAEKRKTTKPRRGRPPNQSSIPDLPKRVKVRLDLLTKETALSSRQIYARLDLDRLGIAFRTLRFYVDTTRKKGGQGVPARLRKFSKARCNATAEIMFLALCRLLAAEEVDAIVDRLAVLKGRAATTP